MQQQQVELPAGSGLADAWGLGWFLHDWHGTRVIGHDGGTLGQSAFLRIVPESGFAVALLTNGGNPASLYHDLFTRLFGDRLGIGPTELEWPEAAHPVDASRVTGTFTREGVDIEIREGGDTGLEAELTLTGPLAALLPPTPTLPVRTTADGQLVTRHQGRTMALVLSDPADDGRPQWLFFGGRAARRGY